MCVCVCVCVSVIRHNLPLFRNVKFFCDISISNQTATLLGMKMFFLLGGCDVLCWMGWSVCNCTEDESISSSPCS